MQDDESTLVSELTEMSGHTTGGSLTPGSGTMRNLPALDTSIVDDHSFSGGLSFDGGSVDDHSLSGSVSFADGSIAEGGAHWPPCWSTWTAGNSDNG